MFLLTKGAVRLQNVSQSNEGKQSPVLFTEQRANSTASELVFKSTSESSEELCKKTK